MRWPRFQFGTSTLFLATAFIAVSVGGTVPLFRAATPIDWAYLGHLLALLSPIWVPVLFVAYAAGRRALTLKIVLAFAACEAGAVWTFWALMP